MSPVNGACSVSELQNQVNYLLLNSLLKVISVRAHRPRSVLSLIDPLKSLTISPASSQMSSIA